MPNPESVLPPELRNKYEFHNFGHALEILPQACPEEWNDLLSALRGFTIPISEVLASGGNKSAIPTHFEDLLYPKGWREIRITGVTP